MPTVGIFLVTGKLAILSTPCGFNNFNKFFHDFSKFSTFSVPRSKVALIDSYTLQMKGQKYGLTHGPEVHGRV